jgi:hypothetical protein
MVLLLALGVTIKDIQESRETKGLNAEKGTVMIEKISIKSMKIGSKEEAEERGTNTGSGRNCSVICGKIDMHYSQEIN